MYIVLTAAVLLSAYLIGSVNFGVVLSRLLNNDDVRKYGSNSAGATNMLRTYGFLQAILTLLLDMLKAVVAVLAGRLCGEWTGAAAGILVMVGHCWPVYYGFKGGKGVAAALGVGLVLCWQAALIGAAAAIGIACATKYMSLGSLIGVFLGALLMTVFKGVPTAIVAAAMVIIVTCKHRANIIRLKNGTENKLEFGKKHDQQ